MSSFAAEFFPSGLAPSGKDVAWSAGPGLVCSRRPLPPAGAAALAQALGERSAALRALSSVRIIAALAALHSRWARERSPLRDEAVELLHRTTGYPKAVIDLALRDLFGGMRAADLRKWLRAAGIAPGSLDEPVAPQRRLRVFGPRLTVLVGSGNVPGAALPSLVQALLLKSPCLVKTASNEPVLFPLYARSLSLCAEELAEAVAVTGWAGGDAEVERAVLAHADALIAYGSDGSLAGLRALLPVRARFLGYGHRISFAAVGRELLTFARADEAAAAVARDAAMFDQQGCLSPQAVYVERGGEVAPEDFAARLADSLERLEQEWPRRALDAAEAGRVHQFRTELEIRALVDPRIRVRASQGSTCWTVALDPDPALAPCCLNRTVVVRPLDDLTLLPPAIAPCGAALSTAALGLDPKRLPELAQLLAASGVTRVSSIGGAQRLRSALHHDGVNALAALARFATTEPF